MKLAREAESVRLAKKRAPELTLPPEFSSMKVAELKEKLGKAGLSTAGRKSVLLARLAQHLVPPPSAAGVASDVDPAPGRAPAPAVAPGPARPARGTPLSARLSHASGSTCPHHLMVFGPLFLCIILHFFALLRISLHCFVFLRIALCRFTLFCVFCSALRCVALFCFVLVCVALCCLVLLCVALCCLVWLCVALCCFVLLCVA